MKHMTLIRTEQNQPIAPLSEPARLNTSGSKKSYLFLLAYQLALCSTGFLLTTTTTTEKTGECTMKNPDPQIGSEEICVPYTQTTLCSTDHLFLLQRTKFSISDTATCYWLTFCCLPEMQDPITASPQYAFNVSFGISFHNGAVFPDLSQIT